MSSKHGDMNHIRPEDKYYFWTLVNIRGKDECWEFTEWPAPESGYVRFHCNYKTRLTHRAARYIARGPIPDGLLVCQKCDNPPCVNPNHLFIRTHKDNTQDMVKKERHRGGKNRPSLNM